VRRAVLGLATLGLVSVEQGRGTFVQPGAIDYSIGRRTRFTENLQRLHHAPSGAMLSAVRLKADANVAKSLVIRARAWVYKIETRHESDGVPLTFSRNWYSAARFPDMPNVFERTDSITKALAQFGVRDYVCKWSRIGSVLPEAEVARRLNISTGSSRCYGWRTSMSTWRACRSNTALRILRLTGCS
jgi:GntR family phosphonate transport system transcriptional regulator